MTNRRFCRIALILALFLTLIPVRAVAQGYDIDCGIILCLPAGFPSGCDQESRANGVSDCDGCRKPWKEFIRRITSIPPKPPIGHCPMGSSRDIVMHDEHKDRMQVMFDQIDHAGMERSLRSVKIRYYANPKTCYKGRDANPYPCTLTYYMNGDGTGFARRTINGHFSGVKVFYTDLDGRNCIAGDSQVWVPPVRKCRPVGRDNEYCYDVSPGHWARENTCGF